MKRFSTVAILLVLAVVGGALAMQNDTVINLRHTFYTNRNCCDLSMAMAVKLTIDQEVYGIQYPAHIGQDRWVLFRMFPGVTDGFFLDVGSGDGTLRSNSKALEARGWKGICIDPFPTKMEDRTCQVFKDVVWSVSGHTLRFHTMGELGGVADTLGKWKEAAAAAPIVELRTVTLAEILERSRAPSFIHFLSLDIEGAELEALRGLPFDRYRFGAMAIEHNEEEPKRTDILNFLAERGYRRVFSWEQDDFYAPDEP